MNKKLVIRIICGILCCSSFRSHAMEAMIGGGIAWASPYILSAAITVPSTLYLYREWIIDPDIQEIKEQVKRNGEGIERLENKLENLGTGLQGRILNACGLITDLRKDLTKEIRFQYIDQIKADLITLSETKETNLEEMELSALRNLAGTYRARVVERRNNIDEGTQRFYDETKLSFVIIEEELRKQGIDTKTNIDEIKKVLHEQGESGKALLIKMASLEKQAVQLGVNLNDVWGKLHSFGERMGIIESKLDEILIILLKKQTRAEKKPSSSESRPGFGGISLPADLILQALSE